MIDNSRNKLINALHTRGLSSAKGLSSTKICGLIESTVVVEIVDGRSRKPSNGQTDYVLRDKVTSEAQPVAVMLIEANTKNFRLFRKRINQSLAYVEKARELIGDD